MSSKCKNSDILKMIEHPGNPYRIGKLCTDDLLVLFDSLLNGKAQYSCPPRTNYFRSVAFDIVNIT